MREAFWKKCTPAVSRHWLWLMAGLLWSVVGIGLCLAACRWLSGVEWPWSLWAAFAGFLGGILIYRYGFSKIAAKNIRRIARQTDPTCFFAFQAWRSYLLILTMVLLGAVLRHSHLSKLIVSTLYMAIGTGLALSSSLYYDELASMLLP